MEPDFESFADDVLQMIYLGSDADGGEVQESALRHNVLKAVRPDKPCGEGCVCIDYFSEDF